jgi:methionyl-tRNA formyltransferase
VAYGQILRAEVLAIPHHGVLNVHPSLLPRWRGASPIAAPVLAGDTETGVTIMLMDAGMDTGPVLAQRTHPISPRDTTRTLTVALAEEGASLLVETLPGWVDGRIAARPQVNALATVTRPIRKEDGAIRWTAPAIEIWRQVRAYDPWPGAYSVIGSETIHIWAAWPIALDQPVSPGTVIACPAGMPEEAAGAAFAVQTGAGVLAVLEAQRAGRKRLPSADLLRGWPSLLGSVFETA